MDIRERLLTGLPVIERTVRLGGVATALLEGGEGEPLVLLHGPGEHGAKWLRVIPELARGHRVVVPDLPGHGRSAVREGELDGQGVLGWLDALIDYCGKPPVLVGQILGGAIAARCAARPGQRLRGLVLVDALGLAPFQPAPEFGAALTAFLAQPGEATHDALWQQCAFDLEALRQGLGEQWQLVRAYNLELARRPAHRAVQATLMAEFGFPAIAPAELAAIGAPTALIWGRHDLATPLAVAEAASARYGWPLTVIEDAADDPPLEQPRAFVDALRAALGRF